MSKVDTKIQQGVFTIWSDKIEGRIDPFFYRPEFIEIENELEKIKYEKLKNICEDIKNGSTPPGGVFEGSGIPYFRSQDFSLFDFRMKQFIGEEFHNQIKRSAIKPGDVLLAVVGATLGVVGYVPNRITEGNINQNIARLRVKDKRINPEYLAIFLSSSYGQKQIQRQATVTTQAYLNNEQLGGIKIPIPPFEIQNKIVVIMEKAYEQKHEQETEAQKLLDSIDDYMLGELGIEMPEVKDEMTFMVGSDEIENKRLDTEYYQPGFKKLEKALENGKYKIELLKNFIIEIHYGVSTKNVYVNEGIPLLRILNLKEDYINLSDVVKLPESKRKEVGSAFVRKGDLLISRSGTVGIVSVVPKEAEGFAFGSFMIKFCLSDKINKNFVSIWLNNKISKIFTERERIGSIQGNITIGTIENFRIPCPPLEIQAKVVKEVKKRQEQSEKLKKEAKEILNQTKDVVEKMILGK